MQRNYWNSLVAVLSVAALAACSNKPGQAAETGSAARFVAAGRQFTVTTNSAISSRSAKAGDTFDATVVSDVQDGSGRTAIPAGAVVHGTVIEVKPSPRPGSAGSLTLDVSSVTVHGTDYRLDAGIDSLATERQGRGVTGSDAAKVGVGAAAGAIVGQIIGKNPRGTVIGAVVGAAAGAGYAAATKDSDVNLPAGTHILITLRQRLTVSGS